MMSLVKCPVLEPLQLSLVARAARELVVYHRRPGGQSLFSTLLDLDPESDRIRAALAFAREHLRERLPVERLAAIACLSPRQFGRAFRAETGETPAKAVERLRAEAAKLRIETSAEAIEVIAREVGFSAPNACAARFCGYSASRRKGSGALRARPGGTFVSNNTKAYGSAG